MEYRGANIRPFSALIARFDGQKPALSAVVLPFRVADNARHRQAGYPEMTSTQPKPGPSDDRPPGSTIRWLRKQRGWSQLQLGEACEPPLDPTSIGRIEKNESYTSDSLGRIARALKVSEEQLFLPVSLMPYATLDDAGRERVESMLQDMATAQAYRAKQT